MAADEVRGDMPGGVLAAAQAAAVQHRGRRGVPRDESMYVAFQQW